MADGNQKRLTAKKVPVEDVVNGTYHTQEGFKSNYIVTPRGEKVSRVNLIGTVMAKFINDDETYGFLVLDDETETIRGKFFQDMEPLESVKEGDLVRMVGKIREYEDEIYVNPEIVKSIDDPNEFTLWLADILNRLEKLEKVRDRIEELKQEDPENYKEKAVEEFGEETVRNILEAPDTGESEDMSETETGEAEKDGGEIKNAVLSKIEDMDEGKGASYQDITESLDYEEQDIEEVINDLLTDGTCFEPRPGRIKKL
ncbi:MAG: OB-fold nucleic acid binding domain-containing protein [Candidatus Aenigmatarchaeota archaeon]